MTPIDEQAFADSDITQAPAQASVVTERFDYSCVDILGGKIGCFRGRIFICRLFGTNVE
jgi:hypothetical protein